MEFEEGFKATDTESIEKAGLNKQYVLKPIHCAGRFQEVNSLLSAHLASDIAKLIASVFNEQVPTCYLSCLLLWLVF
jgi:hypothetical protein